MTSARPLPCENPRPSSPAAAHLRSQEAFEHPGDVLKRLVKGEQRRFDYRARFKENRS